LHTVRRLAAHLAETGTLPGPLAQPHKGAEDPLLTKAYAKFTGEPAGPFDHLIYHSDCEGYYVPVDFAQVIADDSLPGGYLGSSVRLLAETRRIASALGLPEDLDADSEEVLGAYRPLAPQSLRVSRCGSYCWRLRLYTWIRLGGRGLRGLAPCGGLTG
jgi:hypothetical protein